MSQKPTYEELERRVQELEGIAAECDTLRKALAESRERYTLLAENVTDVIWVMDESLQLNYLSPSIERLSGFTAEELMRRSFSDQLTPRSFELLNKAVQMHLQDFFEQRDGPPDPLRVELEDIRRDGSTGWSEVNMTLVKDSEGRFAGIVGVSRDISDRKKTEEVLQRYRDHLQELVTERTFELSKINQELEREIAERRRGEEAIRKSEQEYRLLADNIADVIWTSNLDMRFTYVSPSVESLRGYAPEEAMGHSLADALTPESLKTATEVLRREWASVEDGTFQPMTMELEFLRKDGSTVWTESTISVLYDADRNPIFILGVTRDITERRQVEREKARLEEELRQAQKMESIGRLAGGVAHDFNNLLSPILGYSQLVLLGLSPDDPRHDQLLQIQNAANRARELTQRLLALSRKQVLELITLDLGEAVSGFEKILAGTIREDVSLQVRIVSPESRIKADVSQIQQILMNLTVNARDAMPEGGRILIEVEEVYLDRIRAENHPDLKPGPYVSLTVSDTGQGMDSDTLQRAFEPFFTTKEMGKGTGLGLAMVHGIVKQHGGSISVQSEPGQGTAFKILFPSVDAAATGERSAVGPCCEEDLPGGRETVMVVEDDVAVRRLVVAMLKAHGYRAIDAESADHCLDLMKQFTEPVDLLLTDVVMPGMNGKALYQELIRFRPTLRVLYMSGYAEDVIAHHGVLEDGIHFIQKPLAMHALLGKVRGVLETPQG